MKLFLDSSALIALHNRDDEHHQESTQVFESIAAGRLKFSKLYCSDYIIDEAVTACRARTRSLKLAVELGDAILQSKSIITLNISKEIFMESWELFKLYRDIPLSFTDCTTAILAKRTGISIIFTFDKDFERLGFERIP